MSKSVQQLASACTNYLQPLINVNSKLQNAIWLQDFNTTHVPTTVNCTSTTSTKISKLAMYIQGDSDVNSPMIKLTLYSTSEDPQAPITSGFFNLEKGCKATTTFPFSEHKFVMSGTIIVSDQNGQKFICRAGDSFYIPNGATSKFLSTRLNVEVTDKVCSHI